jgi:hypothetical protein
MTVEGQEAEDYTVRIWQEAGNGNKKADPVRASS